VDDGLTPKLQWRVARVVDSEPETESAQTIGLTVPGWGGHLAGQHIDLKLTAEDGYSAQRSYSLSRPIDGERIELTVQQIADGEVSPYLTGVRPGEEIELRGPIGGWFVWRPAEQARILLVAGGSGIVPLMAMLRQRITMGSAEFRLVCSVRSPADIYYAKESRWTPGTRWCGLPPRCRAR
jgi:ferredoxin-NADP reductase